MLNDVWFVATRDRTRDLPFPRMDTLPTELSRLVVLLIRSHWCLTDIIADLDHKMCPTESSKNSFRLVIMSWKSMHNLIILPDSVTVGHFFQKLWWTLEIIRLDIKQQSDQGLQYLPSFGCFTQCQTTLMKHHYDMSLVSRKPVFGVCDQGRLKPACSATEAN